MTTAPQTRTTHATAPPSDARHLSLVRDAPRHAGGQLSSVPMVGYLLLVPEGTDPAELFAEGRPRPEIRPVDPADPIPALPAAAQPAAVDDVIRIDPVRHVAELEGRELDLTYLEFALLAHLVKRPHHVLTRELLVTAVWGYDHVGDGRTVDVHIARLRRKLGRAHRQRIVTVRRVGYKYVPERRPDGQESPDSTPCHRP
ncbi:winged helix-turn-helix domain-containing protein [Streptomyces endophyticus]|uniref:Winged helix-turn-helix domain-containing protein n=1 Tax=Streptomyces endophyticus TaxID=714166 RepID=A0ABU6F9I8_9ACTN|nr:winged helix-turn-helix domain-containing protein [Streptomyces endophyticus]MEB8340702.1 winged helix-turn-helix domain-containing protein [Streptomyces endophyticus]